MAKSRKKQAAAKPAAAATVVFGSAQEAAAAAGTRKVFHCVQGTTSIYLVAKSRVRAEAEAFTHLGGKAVQIGRTRGRVSERSLRRMSDEDRAVLIAMALAIEKQRIADSKK